MSAAYEIAVTSDLMAAPPVRHTRTLLVTDDQPSVLHTLDYVFQLHGYRTIVATSGAVALDAAAQDGFDAALIDLHMPGIDGLTVCRALRERAIKRGRDVPVWMMSAAHTSVAATSAMKAGAIALLKKPFDVEEFLMNVERCCAGKIPNPPLMADSPSTVASGA